MTVTLELGTVILSRYRIDERLSGELSGAFGGLDEQTAQRILAFELPTAEAASLRGMLTVSHPHIARLIDIVERSADTTLVVAEHIQGSPLSELLAESGQELPVDAVRSTLRIADALSHMHAVGSVHGSVRPAAIVARPVGRRAPILTFVPPAPSPYRCPERDGVPASEADDAWAAAALLLFMLTGRPPPSEGFGSAQQVAAAGVEDPDLQAALLHALARDRAARSSDLKPLKRELARWFAEHAGEELPSSRPSSRPPPLPLVSLPVSSGGNVAMATSQRTGKTTTKRRPVALLGGLGIVLGIAAAWGVSALRPRPDVVVERAAKPVDTAPTEAEIALSAVPVTGRSTALGEDKLTSCVAGFLPKGTFAKPMKLDWLCTVVDPRQGAVRLRSAVVAGAPPWPSPTEAMKLFSQMASYDLAAFAVLRAGCCVDPPALELPAPNACPDMASALSDLGKAVADAAGDGKDEPLARFTQAMECEVKAGRSATFNFKSGPLGYEKDAFLKLVEHVQQP